VATLVDSNVILDVVTDDEEWKDWSSARLSRAADAEHLVINPLIYAEVAAGFDSIEALDGALPADYFIREPLPWEAAFLAARAFLSYRGKGGAKRAPLPDFYIGAHAAIAGHKLLTRDPRRYRAYFPKLQIIAP
jgi:predicted nucleic acid-binding protein